MDAVTTEQQNELYTKSATDLAVLIQTHIGESQKAHTEVVRRVSELEQAESTFGTTSDRWKTARARLDEARDRWSYEQSFLVNATAALQFVLATKEA